jgi:ParB family transcriptional regulator, chromosome partitioning protein
MNKKKELGKGLRALLSNIEQTTNTEDKKELVKELTSSINFIPLDSIEVNPFQPRKDFDPEELENLSKSIAIHGLIQPLTVRSLGGNNYQLISGERRMRASKMAGLKEVPAYVRIANDQEMLEMALIENIQRADLNAVEVAISYQRLIDECKLTHDNLSDRVCKNRSTVTNYLRLLKLPPEIQTSIKIGKISMGHARVLAGVQDIGLQLQLFNKTIEGDLSVRAIEELAKEKSKSNAPTVEQTNASGTIAIELERIKKELSGIFGTKTEIVRNNNGKGKIVLSFNNDNEFNNIYDLLKEIES